MTKLQCLQLYLSTLPTAASEPLCTGDVVVMLKRKARCTLTLEVPGIIAIIVKGIDLLAFLGG